MSANTRLSTSSGSNSTIEGYCAVGADKAEGGVIPYAAGDVFYIKGATWPDAQNAYVMLATYANSAGSYPSTSAVYLYKTLSNSNYVDFEYDEDTGIAKITIKDALAARSHLRFSLQCANPDDLIITKNEEIGTA